MKAAIYLAALSSFAVAHPSMKAFEAELTKRAGGGSTAMWGDVDEPSSETGKSINGIFTGKESGLSDETYDAPPMDSDECQKDDCCVWKYISEDMLGMMQGNNGCNDFARGAIRMGFHDAGAWEMDDGEGGADGSILLAPGEINRSENTGLPSHGNTLKSLHSKYSKNFKIGMADFIQCAAKVGVMACKGPRIRIFVGRPDSDQPAPSNRLPSSTFSASQSMDMFGKKGVSPAGLVALLGAHTCSQSHGQSPAVPQDPSPGSWDTDYFSETLQSSASPGVGRFMSDVLLAKDSETRPVFEDFANNLGSWDQAYASEYIRMSLFGVMKMNDLKECSKAMPGGSVKSKPDEKKSSTSEPAKQDKTTSAAPSKETSESKSMPESPVTTPYSAPEPTTKAAEPKPVAASGAAQIAGSLLLAVAGAVVALL